MQNYNCQIYKLQDKRMYILKEARNQKPKGIWIYEDFSKEAVKITKELWGKVRELRSQNKYAILVYDWKVTIMTLK